MDGGREWDDEQWMSEYARYKSIFRNRSPDSMRVYDMAGNHDIGIGNTVVQHALERFHSQVGPTNRIVTLADHQLVLLDTLTLESDTKTVGAASRRLVQQLAANNSDSKQTRLLFSHVPLWRPNGTYCGPLRQSAPGHLLNRRGYQFRDQLFENTTKYLLDSIRPAAVFSGDDHDTCTVDHPIASTGRQATEYTIGALGWASGVPVASYGLLTLYPRGVGRSQPPVHTVQNCFLPYQLGIYKVYALSFIASLLLAAASCYSGARSWRPTLCKPSDDYELLVDHGGEQQQPYALVPRQDTDDQAQEMSLPMPGTTTATTPGKWTLNQRGYAVRVATTVRSVAVVAVPVYIASILYFYIV
ncbi:hypothetical protein GGI02_003005 [Coemansia sp. RSA 2322]|nr:hypothetical protein GGI02_003005 [Coemansia sp. RSA 2322]